MRKLFKFIYQVIAVVSAILYVSFFYAIGHYEESFDQIGKEVFSCNKSKNWVIQEHIKMILACVFLFIFNAIAWYLTIINIAAFIFE